MRKIIISFIAILLALYGTVASGSYPMKGEVPAPLSQGRADTLLQFTSGGHVLGFTPNRVYMAGMGHALTEEFIGANTVTPKSVSSHRVVYENLWKGISLTYSLPLTVCQSSDFIIFHSYEIVLRKKANFDKSVVSLRCTLKGWDKRHWANSVTGRIVPTIASR